MQNSFSELMRLLVLLALTFAAAIFGSFWVWALTAALGWTAVAGLREKFRAA